MSSHAIVDAGSSVVVYLTESRKIFRVAPALRDELTALCEDTSLAFETENSSLAPIAAALRDCRGASFSAPSQNALRKISLNITNACNMACRYCYANEGEYNSPTGKMTVKVALQAVDSIFSRYDGVGAVQFFGGEPLMNVEVIEAVCNELARRVASGDLATAPVFGLVTNGTIVNERIERVLREHRIHVTVSFDGPPVLNDLMRPLKSGRHASERIIENARRLAEASGQPVGIETTWSKAQQDAGLGVAEVVGYLRDAFHTRDVHVAPVILPEEHPYRPQGLAEFAASVPAFTDQVLAGDMSTFAKFRHDLGAYVRGLASDIFCDAGLTNLSISSSGRVYPCFMFIDVDDFDMGSVFDPELFQSERFKVVRARFAAASKQNSEQCGSCAFRTLCSGCLGANYFETGDPFLVSRQTCDMNRDFHEAMLVAAHRVASRV